MSNDDAKEKWKEQNRKDRIEKKAIKAADDSERLAAYRSRQDKINQYIKQKWISYSLFFFFLPIIISTQGILELIEYDSTVIFRWLAIATLILAIACFRFEILFKKGLRARSIAVIERTQRNQIKLSYFRQILIILVVILFLYSYSLFSIILSFVLVLCFFLATGAAPASNEQTTS